MPCPLWRRTIVSMDTFIIEPRGPFSLAESAQFGFGQRQGERQFDGTMRLAFCVDGYRHHAGVSLTQAADATVHGTIWTVKDPTDPTDPEDDEGPADRDTVVAQVARVLSL